MAGLAAGALGASVLLEVVVSSTHGSPIVVLTNLSYPLGDIVLLALVVFVFAVTGWRPGRAWLLIGAALLLNAIGDGIYLYTSATRQLRRGGHPRRALAGLVDPRRALGAGRHLRPAARQRRPRAARAVRDARRLRPDRDACSSTARSHTSTRWRSSSPPATIVLVLARTALTFRENTRLLDAQPHRVARPTR